MLRKMFTSATSAVTTAPAATYGTVAFPASVTGGGVLVRNQGSRHLVLFYSDAEPSGDPSWTAAAQRMASSGTFGGGTHTIAPGQWQFLTDTIAGPTVTYCNGPFVAIAGSINYVAELPNDAVTT